ncbi:MAG: hypothetical protein QXS54_04415, partial [Candidatus Methanomethylicaceae archaeon]
YQPPPSQMILINCRHHHLPLQDGDKPSDCHYPPLIIADRCRSSIRRVQVRTRCANGQEN